MEPHELFDILRRRWWLLIAMPLLVALLSWAAAAARPARYGVDMRLLITRYAKSAAASGRTDQGQDTTAQDLAAIMKSTAFRRDLAQELARAGYPTDEATLVSAISAVNSGNQVVTAIEAADPAHAIAIAKTLITVTQTHGLRYWGDQSATPEHPGLRVGVLDPPEQVVRRNGPRSLALEVGLRALAGLGAAIGLAVLLHYIEDRKVTRVYNV